MKGKRQVEYLDDAGRVTVTVTLPGGARRWIYADITPASVRRFLQVMNSWFVSSLLFREHGWSCTVQPPEALARSTLSSRQRRERKS